MQSGHLVAAHRFCLFRSARRNRSLHTNGPRGAHGVQNDIPHRKSKQLVSDAQERPSKAEGNPKTALDFQKLFRLPTKVPSRSQPVLLPKRAKTAQITTRPGMPPGKIKSLPDVIFPGDSNTMELSGGRGVMGFAVFGYADPGRCEIPLLYFGGIPGTRLEASRFNDWGLRRRLPIISVEKPGSSLSTFYKGSKIVDGCWDAAELVRPPHQWPEKLVC